MSATIKCLILDDEQPAINILKTFVKKVPFLHLVKATTDAFHALDILQNQIVDLLFIDIQMPDLTGIEFIKSLEKRPMIIFTTAFDEYAMQGFELDVIDYLLKPIPFDRFLKASNKALKNFKIEHPNSEQASNFLIVKVDYQNVKISFDDILYVEGLKDYVKIYTNEKMVMTRLNLKGIGTKLPERRFLRIHRSFIVPFDKITTFQKSQVTIGNKIIPVGESYKQTLLDRM